MYVNKGTEQMRCHTSYPVLALLNEETEVVSHKLDPVTWGKETL